MKKNDEIELVCTDLSDQGFGIGHHEGMTVFADNLLPGEKARVKVIKLSKTYAIGKVVERLITSKDRIEPACAQANRCGGCALMHLKYDRQLDYKEKQLKDLFHAISPEIEVLKPLGMAVPYHYRNKAQFPVRIQNGKVEGGFYRARSNDIVPVRECMIQSEKINEIYQWLLDHLSLDQAGSLRHLLLRESKKTSQVQVVFIGEKNHNLKSLTHKLVHDHPEVASVIFNLNQRKDNVILGDQYEVLYGQDYIAEKCLDLDIQLHFKSFFQINPQQMEVLYSKALEMADLNKDDQVIELYSGTGTIGLLAARKAGYVTGVEIVPEAVANARVNQQLNGIENARFVCMDASEFAAKKENQADVVLVDPPRKGMTRQGIEDICALEPKRVVYISCNPRTLARDLKEFASRDYQCLKIQPVDMFAHTTGMECIALLVRKNPVQDDRQKESVPADNQLH